MATKLSGASSKNDGLAESVIDSDHGEFGTEPEVVPSVVPVAPKDPMIRRKIEDRLERIRLREQLGLYDDDQWSDL